MHRFTHCLNWRSPRWSGSVRSLAATAILFGTASAFGQRQPPQQVSPTPPTAVPEEPIPAPGPNDQTEYVSLAGVPIDSSSLVKAVKQTSGARASYVRTANSLVLTGTAEQLALARTTCEKLIGEAKSQYERQQEEERARTAKPESQTGAGMVSLDFPGGSMLDYIKAVSDGSGFEGTIIQEPSTLAELKLPAVKLRGATLRTALEIMSRAGSGSLRSRNLNLRVNWIPDQRYADPEEDNRWAMKSACVISVEAIGNNGQATRTVFDLSAMDATTKADVQTVLDAITVAIEMNGESTTFAAKYHEPSRILIVRGTPEELSLVREVLRIRAPEATVQKEEAVKVDAASPSGAAADALQELKARLTQVAEERQKPNLTAEQKNKLKAEFVRLVDQIKAAQRPE
jgi:hypothetical protein